MAWIALWMWLLGGFMFYAIEAEEEDVKFLRARDGVIIALWPVSFPVALIGMAFQKIFARLRSFLKDAKQPVSEEV